MISIFRYLFLAPSLNISAPNFCSRGFIFDFASNMETSKTPSVNQVDPELEKGETSPGIDQDAGIEHVGHGNRLQSWTLFLEKRFGIEARGIERVPESLRQRKTSTADYIQMCLIWFSANLTANNLLIGLLGPTLFEVGYTDGMVLGTFGAILGAIPIGYISTFGPLSGNRTLVSTHVIIDIIALTYTRSSRDTPWDGGHPASASSSTSSSWSAMDSLMS